MDAALQIQIKQAQNSNASYNLACRVFEEM